MGRSAYRIPVDLPQGVLLLFEVGFRATTEEGKKAIYAVLGHALDQMGSDFEKLEARAEESRNRTDIDDNNKDGIDRKIKTWRRARDQTYARLQDARDYQLQAGYADVLPKIELGAGNKLPEDVLPLIAELTLGPFSAEATTEGLLRLAKGPHPAPPALEDAPGGASTGAGADDATFSSENAGAGASTGAGQTNARLENAKDEPSGTRPPQSRHTGDVAVSVFSDVNNPQPGSSAVGETNGDGPAENETDKQPDSGVNKKTKPDSSWSGSNLTS
jgi:hypothetical protein